MADTDYTPSDGAIPAEPAQTPAEKPEVPPERAALVKKLLEKVKRHEKRFEKRFKQMRADMKLTRKGASDEWNPETQYTANLIQRHVKQRVSALYAKNPTVRARRRKTLDYQVWDGNMETAKAALAMAGAQMSGMPVQPGFEKQVEDANALLSDIAQGREREKLMDGVGKTLEIVYTYYMGEGQPPFKLRAKQLVRRTVTTGVGYVKLGYQRQMGRTPDWTAKLSDASEKFEHLQRLSDEAAEGESVFEGSAELEELRLMIDEMQQQPEVILREGLIFDFPRSYDVIPIGDCVELKGFVGCEAVAQRMLFQPDRIEEIYGKDLKGEYTKFTRSGQKQQETGQDDWVCVYEYYDKPSGLMYTLAEGYCDFLEEPTPPPATVEQFFPLFVISFNDIEDEEDIFPPSDPQLLRSQQMEYNRAREALRQHRIANQPNYAAPAGAFPDWSDETKIMSAVPHEILKLNALAPGMKVSDVIQPIAKLPIQPELYDTQFVFDDILRTVGAQEANLGGLSGSTATESSIAENSRMTAQSSEIDDMDDMLSQLARAGGQILLKELSAETARKIAGPGAKWPELSALEIAEELFLDIEAGSSGKPNKSMELANWERLLPTLIQIPGVSPTWVAKESIKRLDDRADLVEAILDGAPSIMAMNGIQKAASSNPQDQGVHGGDNQERAPEAPGGAQPNYGPEGGPSPEAQAQPQGGSSGEPQPQGAPMPQGQPQPEQQQPQIDMQAIGQQLEQGVSSGVEAIQQTAQQAIEQIQQASGSVSADPAIAQIQEMMQQVIQGIEQSNSEAMQQIQQAAAAAVDHIREATATGVNQVTNNAAAVGVQKMLEKMTAPQQASPLDQMLQERLGRLNQ